MLNKLKDTLPYIESNFLRLSVNPSYPVCLTDSSLIMQNNGYPLEFSLRPACFISREVIPRDVPTMIPNHLAKADGTLGKTDLNWANQILFLVNMN